MKRLTPLLALICCVGALAVTGCGSSSSSSSVPTEATLASSASPGGTSATTKSFATTKFAIHAGLAFGAFHHWIYKPIKAGALRNPTAHKLALAKAGLAAVFVYHELKVAADDAKSSKVLSPLVAPLTAAGDKLSSLKTSIAHGSVNEADIDSVNSQLGQIGSTASASGQSIKETVPSLAQLTAGSS